MRVDLDVIDFMKYLLKARQDCVHSHICWKQLKVLIPISNGDIVTVNEEK